MSIKPEIKFGVLCTLFIILWTLVQYALGFHSRNFEWGQYSGYLNYAFIFFFLWKGLNEKWMDHEGKFSLRRGMREGVIQLMITSSVASIFMFFYDYKINALWVEDMISYQRTHGISTGYFVRFANDTNAQSIILSNTETHLCLFFLSIVIVGSSMAFMISAILSNKKYQKSI